MSESIERGDDVRSPVWLRGLGALLLLLLAASVGWALWIAALNFDRIGV